MKKVLLFTLVIVATTTILAAETARVGKKAPDFTLKDYKGGEHKLSDYAGKYVVLEWTNFDCPCVGKHYKSDNMQSMQREYTEKGVIWLTISSSGKGKPGNYPPSEIEKKIADWKSAETAYLVDEDGTVGKEYNAKATPDIVVIAPDQNIVYMGAVDDISGTDVEDIPKAHNYVRDALNSSMNGEPIKVKSSKPYGCSIKYADK